YNVVHIHTRGVGMSQIEASNRYDKYLRNEYIIGDAEAVRVDLGITQWDAVIGQSYGTLLANEYAARFPRHVGRLLLTGTATRNDFLLVLESNGHVRANNICRETRVRALREIFATHPAFASLRQRPDLVDAIADHTRSMWEGLTPFVDTRNILAGKYFQDAAL